MSSSGLTRGSLYGILEFPKIRHCEGAKRLKQSLGILEFIYGILNSSLEILNLFLEF